MTPRSSCGAGAVIVAAGQGHRLGGTTPKQFLNIKGRPMIQYVIEAIEKCRSVKCAILVLRQQDLQRGRRILARARRKKKWAVIPGGRERFDSVREGLMALPAGCDPLLIHDAARPFATPLIFDHVARAASKYGAALAAIPCPDTIKKEKGHELVRTTVLRKGLWLAQTPQGFRRSIAVSIFKGEGRGLTDDVQIAEKLKRPVKLVRGSPLNFKITVPDDLALARAWASRQT